MIQLLIVTWFALFVCPLRAAQGDAPQIAGTWQAKFEGKVFCTITIDVGEKLSGTTEACTIHIDDDGNLLSPEKNTEPQPPAPISNALLRGDTLRFEVKEIGEDDVVQLELKLTSNGRAELRFPQAPRIKPILFGRLSRTSGPAHTRRSAFHRRKL